MDDAVTWDPTQYGRYAGPRLRPAIELLARVDHPSPRRVHDLGCGRGEMARAMASRWVDAEVIGSDRSQTMLDEAARTPSRVQWQLADLRGWQPSEPLDVIYSNAVLHWVDNHEAIFTRLVASLASGGILAVQMPLSWGEPSHRLMRETLAGGGDGGTTLGTMELRERYDRRPVAAAADYHTMLRPLVSDLDIWETRYLQALEGDEAVFEWVKGTALRPILETLEGEELEQFVGRYRAELLHVYPPSPGGVTLYPFPRLFIVATR